MTMRRAILSLLISGTLLVGLCVLPSADHGTGPARIEEDNPAWDCRTMGNLRCGPQR